MYAFAFLFGMFLVSGFCALLYQVIWLRLAFAEFGVITPVISVLLSVFMLGLSLGSWAAGKWARPLSVRLRISPILIYGVVEILIGVGAFVVPVLFRTFSALLLDMGEQNSFQYLLGSGASMMIAILPWCFLMGMTFPLGIAFMETQESGRKKSFSFLYLANVIGAMCGTALTALVLVEFLGFSKTLSVAAFCNFAIGAVGVWLAATVGRASPALGAEKSEETVAAAGDAVRRGLVFGVLFITGFCSMGMEVVWTRSLTPTTKTTIYAFAFLLSTYLLATWVGSLVYRLHLAAGRRLGLGKIFILLAGSSLLPLILNDPRLHPTPAHIFVSLFPICALLGYLTPQLIDRYSLGSAERAGKAYAINVLGCIAGPLFAGYLFLPFFGVKYSLLILAAPLFAYACYAIVHWLGAADRVFTVRALVALAALAILGVAAKTYEDRQSGSKYEVRRDHTATVISTGDGMAKLLLVNGIDITELTPITKIMVHLPLLMMEQKPVSVLVICMGMGTTFRSATTWGIDVTAVELVPSVKEAFGYYFSDAADVLKRPNTRVVIDDGRRFLARTAKKFDLITLDPPPPVEAAGSSLLYSRQFYDLVKSHLKPKGILQQWFPGGETKILNSISRALTDAFPYVRAYRSIENWGYHFLASTQPIPDQPVGVLVSRMPAMAKADLMEWFPDREIEAVVAAVLNHQIPLETVIGTEEVPMISDDRPYNEYFLLRRVLIVLSGKPVPRIR